MMDQCDAYKESVRTWKIHGYESLNELKSRPYNDYWDWVRFYIRKFMEVED